MSKRRKIWLGVLTFVPLFFLIIYLIVFFTIFYPFFELSNNPMPNNELPIGLLSSIIIASLFIILASFIGLGIMIYYILHANKNPDLDHNQKIMWTLLLVLTGSISTIVYYFMYILPDGKKESLKP